MKSLLGILRLIWRAPLLEAAGAAAIVAGIYELAGGPWALIAVGVALLLKALDLDISKTGGADQ